jgi:glycosyltransferase-like protein
VTLYALSKAGDDFFRPLRCETRLLPAACASPNAEPDELIRQRIEEFQRGLDAIGAEHDLWHAEDCLSASALLSAAISRRPVVRTVHHVEHFESPYLAHCQARSILKADRVLSVSEFTARAVSRAFARDSEVIHNGVDHERFARQPREGTVELARRFGVEPSDVVVLSVGGVEERKNSLRALDGILMALARDPRLCWLVVGGDSIWDHTEYRARFAARLAEQPEWVRNRIRCLGPVGENELTALYLRSDVVLAPSLHEGWGLAAIEAMAAGKAVVCSARAPFTEFADEETALLVEPESVAAIGGALSRASRDPELRRRLGRAARERAARFTWEACAREHERAYRRLVAAPNAALGADCTA